YAIQQGYNREQLTPIVDEIDEASDGCLLFRQALRRDVKVDRGVLVACKQEPVQQQNQNNTSEHHPDDQEWICKLKHIRLLRREGCCKRLSTHAHGSEAAFGGLLPHCCASSRNRWQASGEMARIVQLVVNLQISLFPGAGRRPFGS